MPLKSLFDGETVRCGVAPCSLGWVIVGATGRGVCAVTFGDDADTLPGILRRRLPGAGIVDGGPGFAETVEKVVSFVEKPVRDPNIPLDMRGTPFQEEVWRTLRAIPPGTTEGYARVAQRIGRPKAARAVAQACGANRIAVLIPCHRVVRSDGGPGGYGGGLWRKEALLRKERECAGSGVQGPG